jgi:hypothetical protein
MQKFQEELGRHAGFRITFREDPVPHLPPLELGYVHALSEVFYDGNVTSGFRLCKGAGEHPECSGKYHHLVELIARCLEKVSRCDHLLYMTAAKSLPMDGQSCAGRSSSVLFVV